MPCQLTSLSVVGVPPTTGGTVRPLTQTWKRPSDAGGEAPARARVVRGTLNIPLARRGVHVARLCLWSSPSGAHHLSGHAPEPEARSGALLSRPAAHRRETG